MATPCAIVVFDLGGVLVDVDMAAGKRRCRELGYDDAVFEAVEASGAKAAGDVGQADAPAMLETIRAHTATARHLTLDDLRDFWGKTVRWRDFVPSLLGTLQRPFGVLSIIDPIHAEALGPLPGADPIVYSYDIGALKPSPQAYAALIRACRSETPTLVAENITYMDDRPENVTGARLAGLNAFQARGLEDLLHGLSEVLATQA